MEIHHSNSSVPVATQIQGELTGNLSLLQEYADSYVALLEVVTQSALQNTSPEYHNTTEEKISKAMS